jgi:hypothetical protein
MAGTGFHSNTIFRTQNAQYCCSVCGVRSATDLKHPHTCLRRSADNLRVEPICLWYFAANSPTAELAFRGLFESSGWHSAVCLRAECHRSKMQARFVAFHGQFERGVRQMTKIQHPQFYMMRHPL